MNLQVGNVDPVPARLIAVTWRAGTGAAFLTCEFDNGALQNLGGSNDRHDKLKRVGHWGGNLESGDRVHLPDL